MYGKHFELLVWVKKKKIYIYMNVSNMEVITVKSLNVDKLRCYGESAPLFL